MTKTYKNILLIKPSALGDIVHTLPVVSSLRRSFPNAKLSWLVRTEFAPLLNCVEGVDEVLLFDRKQIGKWFYQPAAFGALKELHHKLKSSDFDLVLDLQGLFRTGLFARLTGCGVRVGMSEAREGAGFFYTHKVPKPDHSIHVLDYYFAVLQYIGIQELTPEIHLNAPASDQDAINKLLEANGLADKDFLVLIPSSAHASKCWPAEQFAAAADYFSQTYKTQVVAVGTANDKTIVQSIQHHSKTSIVDFTGRTTIPQLVDLLGRAKAVISNDTGPGYIAEATGTPTVIIYGPTNPQRLIPYRRPECMAALDPDDRGTTIADDNPAWGIEKVPLQLVLDKINAQLETRKSDP